MGPWSGAARGRPSTGVLGQLSGLGRVAPALGASPAGRLASSRAPGPPALFAPDLIPFRPPSCPGSSLELGLPELDGMLEGRGRADILSIAFPEEGHPGCTQLVQAGGGRGRGPAGCSAPRGRAAAAASKPPSWWSLLSGLDGGAPREPPNYRAWHLRVGTLDLARPFRPPSPRGPLLRCEPRLPSLTDAFP